MPSERMIPPQSIFSGGQSGDSGTAKSVAPQKEGTGSLLAKGSHPDDSVLAGPVTSASADPTRDVDTSAKVTDIQPGTMRSFGSGKLSGTSCGTDPSRLSPQSESYYLQRVTSAGASAKSKSPSVSDVPGNPEPARASQGDSPLKITLTTFMPNGRVVERVMVENYMKITVYDHMDRVAINVTFGFNAKNVSIDLRAAISHFFPGITREGSTWELYFWRYRGDQYKEPGSSSGKLLKAGNGVSGKQYDTWEIFLTAPLPPGSDRWYREVQVAPTLLRIAVLEGKDGSEPQLSIEPPHQLPPYEFYKVTTVAPATG